MAATTYRQAIRAELDVAIEWAAAEGWNPARTIGVFKFLEAGERGISRSSRS